MKLPVAVVREREDFLAELLRRSPTISVRAANLAIRTKFGREMRPSRVLAIRKLVLLGNHAVVDSPP